MLGSVGYGAQIYVYNDLAVLNGACAALRARCSVSERRTRRAVTVETC